MDHCLCGVTTLTLFNDDWLKPSEGEDVMRAKLPLHMEVPHVLGLISLERGFGGATGTNHTGYWML